MCSSRGPSFRSLARRSSSNKWLEEKSGHRNPAERPALPWVVEYVSVLLNLCEGSHGGCVAYRRLMGTGGTVKGLCFGEKCDAPLVAYAQPDVQVDVALGRRVCLGMRIVSGGIIVGTSAAAWRTRAVQREPQRERWGAVAKTACARTKTALSPPRMFSLVLCCLICSSQFRFCRLLSVSLTGGKRSWLHVLVRFAVLVVWFRSIRAQC